MTVEAAKLGEPGKTVLGHETGLALSQGEDNWKVPCDRGSQSFDDWLDEQPAPQTFEGMAALVRNAWDHQHQRHCASLRRVGWLDQKGRVWTEVPSTSSFDGGSLTPLLVDARD